VILLWTSLVLMIFSGGLSLFRRHPSSPRWSVAGLVTACLIGIVPAVHSLWTGASSETRLPWNIPGGACHLGIDPLTAFFLIPIFLLSSLAAVYGLEYLQGKQPVSWFFYGLLVAAMVVTVSARNGILFLMGWEIMTLSSFFLVTAEHEKREARQAGWTYLVAAHIGTAFLLVLFLLLSRSSGSMDFDSFKGLSPSETAPAWLLFVCAVIGFGTKAGFMPLHIWLPEAHPAAPSHVSAVMSGVMIKTGIYGLLRFLFYLGAPSPWWGWTFIGIGLTSGVIGVLFALAQHDLKRLLAYHSVENIGIIALGMGVGFLGLSGGSTPLAVLGFGGAVLHVLNHALFKGLLFLGAGAVLHSTHTKDIDHLGGLLKKMPWTGISFLVGAVAISGLPPFNGFISEFMIYLGCFKGLSPVHPSTGPLIAAMTGLALIGGLAAACFSKAFGIVFLGEPRSAHAAGAHEVGMPMKFPMMFLAGGCLLIGIFPTLALRAIKHPLAQLIPNLAVTLNDDLSMAERALSMISWSAGALIGLILLFALGYRLFWRGRRGGSAPTWDCGYAFPSARMQYTASSFAQPLTDLFSPLLRSEQIGSPGKDLFPKDSHLVTETPDVFWKEFYRPVLHRIQNLLARGRILQHGRLQLYVFYIVITLIAVFLLEMRNP